MRLTFHYIFFALCFTASSASRSSSDDNGDFVDETGKALRNLKVVPGIKKSNVDYHSVEQEAGRAVLKLLDAKIGKKVSDAAKEVTDFLNNAVGHHAKQRTKTIQSDKEKEMSLLHLGAQKILTNKDEDNKPKKNKDGSFLVNFKIPYIVTPVPKKKKIKAKKFHHKPAKKPHHIKKFHHRIMHHKPYHPPLYHHANAQDTSRPPQPSYNQPPAPVASSQQPPPSYNAIDLTYNGYNWTYNYSNDTSSDMTPCQGNCMDPCTQACSMSQDSGAPMYQPPVIQNVAPSPGMCPPPCRRSCFTYCPPECCGVAGKRDKVIGTEGSGNEQTAEQDSVSASGQLEHNEEQKSDKQQNSQSQEGSSHDTGKSGKAEKDA
ncbi:hypothetical protein P5673_005215 [Acropora cervicornis]|uniref:Uncharacterized protein n=1 Tax=Acropora cervicornis TaxID=6130 RepID=A0AAD9VDD0_ACRCE|nr:hypothetical protein P5673_005215 [Acropora cervicornis]